MTRLLQSRGVRKFRKNRMAVVAFWIIVGYLLAAAAIGILGVVSVEATSERVGASELPGFYRPPTLETRYSDAVDILDQFDRALGRKDPKAALEQIRLAEKVPAAVPLDELRELNGRARAFARKLAEKAGDDPFSERPDLVPDIGELEAMVEAHFAPLGGLDSFVYSTRLLLGTDRQGRSILARGIYAIKVAIQVGVVTAVIAVLVGSLLGAAAGFFGGWVDHAVTWLYSTFSSIPYLVLLSVLVFMFRGGRFDGTLVPLYVAFGMTFWVGPCRVIRGETLKIKELEYVQAATAVGFGRFYILIRHVIPNTAHLMFINASLLFIGAIKGEVILTYLGLGVKNVPSWGLMITQSKHEVANGVFWQIGTATALMFVLVLAFNILSDALQDAFDPKHV